MYIAGRISTLLMETADGEPEAKRKTLAERAGESRSIAAATPGPRTFVKATSLVGASVSIFLMKP